MSKNSKIFLGVLTFMPPVLFIVYLVCFFNFMFHMIPLNGDFQTKFNPLNFLTAFLPLLLVVLCMVLFSLGLLVYYIIHALNNKRMKSDDRILWVLLFVFVGLIAFPIYWYNQIWKESNSETGLT